MHPTCQEQRRGAAVAATLWALVACLVAMYAALFVLSAAWRIAQPLEELSYGESWLLDGARRIARGEGLYSPADQIPLMHAAYTPVYYAVVGVLLRVFGDHGYALGRLVSLVATLGGTAALAWTVRCVTARWVYGWLAAGLFVTMNLTVLLWGSLHRADALALAITLGGLALATAGRTQLAAVAFLLAFCTKQTYVVAPLAVAVSLLSCRRSLLRFCGILVGGGLLVVAVAQWLSSGWFLWHTIIANSNEPDLATFSTLAGSFLQLNGIAVLAALASFALPVSPAERLWRLYLVGALLLTVTTITKLGASSNYWLEVSAATAALLAIASPKLALWPTARAVAPTLLAGALFVALPGYQATAVEAALNIDELLRPASTRYVSLVADRGFAPYRVDARFIEQIAREPGELLTDNSGLAVAAGKRIAYEFQIFQLLYVEGYWPQRPILDAVAARRFSLVALMHPLDGPADGPRWTPELRRALLAAYRPAGVQSGFWLYRPAP